MRQHNHSPMSKHTTKHRPTKDEMLAAMQEMYGDHITWEDMHVMFEHDGREIKIADPEVVFVGDMSPDIVQGGDSGMSEYEDAREDLSEETESDE